MGRQHTRSVAAHSAAAAAAAAPSGCMHKEAACSRRCIIVHWSLLSCLQRRWPAGEGARLEIMGGVAPSERRRH